MKLSLALGWLVSMVSLTACGDTCDPPAESVYSCTLLPAGSVGCAGDPGDMIGGPAGAPDGVAPFGCEVTLPYCHPFYPDTLAICRCYEAVSSDGGGPSNEGRWACPL